jgi:hypothetical protein
MYGRGVNMTDKTDVPDGSADSPFGPTPEQAASKWQKLLEVNAPETKEFIVEASEQMLPALALAEKLGAQANSLMITMRMLQKDGEKGVKDTGNREKVMALLARVHPLLTLKETLDVYVSNTCEHLLDELEKM